MNKLSKKEKAGVVVSIIWFLLVCMYAVDQSFRYGELHSLDSFFQIMISFNIPLIIGWGIWWIKRD